MTFRQNLEGGVGANHVLSEGKLVQGEGKAVKH